MASVIRDQNISNVWTVEYALELLFIGGLVPEAIWLAHKLGDWKTSVSIGVALQLFCKHDSNLNRYVLLCILRNNMTVLSKISYFSHCWYWHILWYEFSIAYEILLMM